MLRGKELEIPTRKNTKKKVKDEHQTSFERMPELAKVLSNPRIERPKLFGAPEKSRRNL